MLITNFSSGELSPTLNGRIDLQQYYQGAGFLQNFDIIPTGGIKRRVGSRRIVKIDENARIIPFIINKYTSFILEFGENYIQVWEYVNGELLKGQEIETEYESLSVVNEIHYAQNYDTMVIVHRDYKPFELKYKGSGRLGFDFGEINFDYWPDVNLDDDFDFIMIPSGEDAALPVKVTTADGSLKFSYKKGSETITKEYPPAVTKAYCVFNGHLYEYVDAWEISGVDPVEEDVFNSESNYPGCVAFLNNRLYFASTKISHRRYGPVALLIQQRIDTMYFRHIRNTSL